MLPTGSGKPVSVVIGHPHALVREGIARILADGGFQVLGQAGSPSDLYSAVSELEPEIILLDSGFLGVDSGHLGELASRSGGTIVALTTPRGAETSLHAMKAGARGCLSVAESPEKFLQALGLLAGGDLVVSGEASEGLQQAAAGEPALPAGLTDRERDVATLIARGATNRDIADTLMVSQHTVKIHLHHILNKLDLRNRQQIAAYAIQCGLVEDIKTEEY